jgi:hypothetical protein
VTPDPDSQARNRFFVLNLVRLSGAAMLTFGLLTVAGALPTLPMIAGYALVVIGLVDFLVVPPMLARRWRTPPGR